MRESIMAARTGEARQPADGAPVFEFKFAANDPTFAGHFPGQPILPGVFQLEMARVAAEWAMACPLVVSEVIKSKFQRPILPDETVRVELKLTEADGAIRSRANFSVNGQAAGETTLSLCRA
jgi:3-hydroxymyristoyl/3-hydroxydecanoyl-(acyl carrier protein) dehydratase